jgi:hypothetical protein
MEIPPSQFAIPYLQVSGIFFQWNFFLKQPATEGAAGDKRGIKAILLLYDA